MGTQNPRFGFCFRAEISKSEIHNEFLFSEGFNFWRRKQECKKKLDECQSAHIIDPDPSKWTRKYDIDKQMTRKCYLMENNVLETDRSV